MLRKHIAWPTGQQDTVRARIAAHRAADEIVQGTGFENGRGCAFWTRAADALVEALQA